MTPGTVTAQLLYEIAGPEYLNPDVVAYFDTVRLEQVGTDRVLVAGTRGGPPPSTLKVALNYLGGYRNTMTLVLTGLDIEEKARWAEHELFEVLGGRDRFAEVDVRLLRFDRPDAPTNEQATAHLRVTVKDPDPRRVGRAFSNATMELALAGYAGFHTTTPPTAETAYGVYWPTLVPPEAVEQVAVLPDGTRVAIPHTAQLVRPGADPPADGGSVPPDSPGHQPASAETGGTGGRPASPEHTHPAADAPVAGALVPGPAEPTLRIPLGRVAGARSGDKGGNANVGLWARHPAVFDWMRATLTPERFRDLVPEARSLPVHRYELGNLLAINFVVVGLLGEGVAASSRPDPQAKGLGEYVRSRFVEIPERVVQAAGGASGRPAGAAGEGWSATQHEGARA